MNITTMSKEDFDVECAENGVRFPAFNRDGDFIGRAEYPYDDVDDWQTWKGAGFAQDFVRNMIDSLILRLKIARGVTFKASRQVWDLYYEDFSEYLLDQRRHGWSNVSKVEWSKNGF